MTTCFAVAALTYLACLFIAAYILYAENTERINKGIRYMPS